MSLTSWFSADSLRSSRAVSRAVSCPLLTPCAIRSCWFSARFLILPASAEDGSIKTPARATLAATNPTLPFRVIVTSTQHRRLRPVEGLQESGSCGPAKASRASRLRHRGAPVVLLEEGAVVLLREVLEQASDVLGRAELPRERLLVGLQEREERLVAELLVERGEQERPLVVEQAGADVEARDRVPDAVRQRDRRVLVGVVRSPLPVLVERRVNRLGAVGLHEQRRAVLRERLLQPLLLGARRLDDVSPVLVRDLVSEALVDPLRENLIHVAEQRVERLARDEHDPGRRLAEAVVVDLEDVVFGERERPEE